MSALVNGWEMNIDCKLKRKLNYEGNKEDSSLLKSPFDEYSIKFILKFLLKCQFHKCFYVFYCLHHKSIFTFLIFSTFSCISMHFLSKCRQHFKTFYFQKTHFSLFLHVVFLVDISYFIIYVKHINFLSQFFLSLTLLQELHFVFLL